METEVQIAVADALTSDVETGLLLYGRATGEFGADGGEDRVRRWLTLFRDNPLGGGFFVTAKQNGQVVGFLSLIDIEMLVGGAPVRTGKAEFWVVRPDALKLSAPSGERLPWALFEEARRHAPARGYKALQTVSLPATRQLRKGGDLCVKPVLSSHLAPREMRGRIGWRLNRLLRRFRLRLLRDRLRRRAGAAAIIEITRLDEEVGYTYTDALISSGAGMINLRFPPEKHLKLLLQRPGDKPLLFVFTRPTPGQPARLLHASGYPPFEAFIAVLAFVVDLVIACGGAGLLVELPAGLTPAGYDLAALGFSRTNNQLLDCFILAPDLALDGTLAWHVSHGHMGFYSHIT